MGFKKMKKLVFLLISQLIVSIAASINFGDLLFVILTQNHPYHISLAERLKADLIFQAEDSYYQPKVWITDTKGSWTILPVLSHVLKKYEPTVKWVLFCDDHIVINLYSILQELRNHDHQKEIWIGHSLKDTEPTIIHHFQYNEHGSQLIYPNYASGTAMSMPLIKESNKRFQSNETRFLNEFSIDPAFELALFLWNNGSGHALTPSQHFCVVSSETCATYPGTYSACMGPVPLDSLFFAVKTYHKFHENRVSVVKKTWGQHASNIIFFSDIEDSDIPTTSLGIPNTEKGHCGKTIAILQYLVNYLKDYAQVKWIVVADDDTILSVSRICEILSCYGAKNIALGERYGYNILQGKGYDFLTGGGGVIFSVDVVAKLANCSCPSISSPDDMWIGVCLAKYKLPVIHSPLFHQARPIDYSLEHLAPHRPVSFHRHWMVDPLDIYDKWFKRDDSRHMEKLAANQIRHTEL